MTIPAVMFIEMAMDSLKGRDSDTLRREAREFHAFGEARGFEVQHALLVALDEVEPMLAGYLLGLETARALLITNVDAVKFGVSI